MPMAAPGRPTPNNTKGPMRPKRGALRNNYERNNTVATPPTILIRDTTIFESAVLANDQTGKINGARVWVRYPGDTNPAHSTHEGAILATDPESLRGLAQTLGRAADELETSLRLEAGRA